MKLIQKPDFKNFYLSTDNSKFIIFSADTTNAEFDFEKAFNLYTFNFLLVFYKNNNIVIDNNLTNILFGKIDPKNGLIRKIYWVDELGISNIDQCQFIPFNLNITDRYTLGFGSDGQNQILLKSQNNQATISYDNTKSSLVFSVNDGEVHNLNANKTDKNDYNSFLIPLVHQKKLFGFDSKATNNNVGSICFITLQSSEKSIQPTTALLSPNKNNENVLFNYKYFIDDSYSKNVDIVGIIYPTSNFDNKALNYQSFIELFARQDFETCFIDEFGNNLKIPQGSTVINKIAFVSPDANPYSRNFFFMPIDGQSLDLQSNGNYLLLGNSGTERQEKPKKLIFHETGNVLFGEDADGQVVVKDYEGSLTSFPVNPKSDVRYYIDSEKTPFFDNRDKTKTIKKNQSRESDYNPIEVGRINEYRIVPLIPTLSFRNNLQLEEIEKYLVKLRLGNVLTSSIKQSSYISPQGFLKNRNTLSFIKGPKMDGMLKKKSNKGEPRFFIHDADIDIQLSISKEDVFFVTTPALLEDAIFRTNFDIFFSIHDFNIDLLLNGLQPGQIDDNQRIIIFKYSRYTVEELLEDTSKWSNYGKFKKADWTRIKGNIKKDFTSFEQKYNAGTDKDYDYIVQSVYRDRNWNGVFILNVPIANGEDLPSIFRGLTASQKLNTEEPGNEKITLQTPLKLQYVAFPVNKTFINDSGLIEIKSTSYYGLIDYDIIETNKKGKDYQVVFNFFQKDSWQFVMSKLLVRFENSEIRNFRSLAFVKVPNLFEDKVEFDGIKLTNKDDWGNDSDADNIKNLFRLEGNYQKNSAGADEFIFDIAGEVEIKFIDNTILEKIKLTKAAFSICKDESYKEREFRFDLDGDVSFTKDFGAMKDLLKFDSISFKNIGLRFPLKEFKLPDISFDVSKLLVLPKISFDGKGFLSSFPIKFNRFQVFEIKPDLSIPNFDFLNIPVPNLNLKLPGSLWSFVFDFDLGTLGDIELLKKLKGEFLFGWSAKGGFKFGFKLNGPSADGLHLDLFGAMKLDIASLALCSFDNTDNSQTYFLRLVDASLTIFGKELPEKSNFHGIIYAKPNEKTAWLFTATENDQSKVKLALGQLVGPNNLNTIRKVDDVFDRIRKLFDKSLDSCSKLEAPAKDLYNSERNWLVASEDFIPEEWRNIFNLKFVFNDPALYGIYLDVVGLLQVDVLYKKLSENLGVYSAELQLDPSLRNQDYGGVAVTFPNLGVDIFTNGDFKVDIGYPKRSGDWSRSCLIQIRPFVGWAGFYFTKLRTASQSLFAQYEKLLPQQGVNILQAGFAFRIGIGAYIDKGVFYVGASISVYGIMEGAFAFNKGQKSLQKFMPDHFVLSGRVGAIAELVGYVDFRIIKASVYVILRVEFGLMLAVINGKFQPVPFYIEGEVSVSVRVTIACFRIFGRKICIVIHLSFSTWVRLPYTLGGNDSYKSTALAGKSKKLLVESPIKVNFGEIPLVYIPSVTKSKEGSYLIHHFAINFFGIKYNGDKLVFSENNILKDNVIKPILSAIIGIKSMNYSDLRHYFLGGGKGSDDAAFDFTSYKPTLYAGYDDTDENFLKDVFGLKADLNNNEIEDFKNTIKGDPCSLNQKCPFRMIPIPISSNIKVHHKDGTKFQTSSSGFKITIKGIFEDSKGNDKVITNINEEKNYTSTQLTEIEQYFDDYVTQYLDRGNNKKAFIKENPDKDLREHAIIPEYFKLIGLLTLENCYNAFIDADKGLKEDEEIILSTIENPSIILNSDDLVFTCEKQKKNDVTTKKPLDIKIKIDSGHLENIIGQLNYFYNNGLRLPDVLNKTTKTKAFYDLIKQTSSISGVNTNPALANADIIFSKHDGSIPISLKSDMLVNDSGLKDFTIKAHEILSINLDNLNNDITQVSINAPYQLIDVKLSIPNSNINAEDTAYRFFEMPEKIYQNLNSEKVNLKIHTVSNSDVESDEVLKYVSCSNVEVTIKPHIIGGEIKSLELINVYINDLNLMHKVKANPDFIQNISIYLKEEKDGNITYKPLAESKDYKETILIKTNLSPRTHPPVIDNAVTKKSVTAIEKYVANLTEMKDFVRLLWEGVTTNNGGFFLVESDNSDLFSKIPADSKNDIKIVFSFESKEKKPFHAFNNFIRIHKDAIIGRNIFDEFKSGSHSLYAEVLLGSGDKVQEYHTKIPVHCFGFTLKRNKPSKDVENLYLPLEFDITDIQGKTILSKDQILPIMPQHEKDENNGKTKILNDKIDDSKWIYSHITPLLKIDKEGLNRYDSINTNLKYNVNFGLRDTFGFRAANLTQKIENYQHKYFDKLIPINSWPFISVSYWFKEYKNNELKFELKIKAFEKKVKGNYDTERIIESLNTIIAQLSDKNVVAEIDNNFIYSHKELKEKLINSLNYVKTNLSNLNPKESELKVEFILKASSELRNRLNPAITIRRKVSEDLFVNLNNPNVWEYGTIKSISTEINIPEGSTIKLLNDAISKSPYVLGISSDDKKQKVIYLLNKTYLNFKIEEKPSLKRSSYFAIKPYSNRLWSGDYTAFGVPKTNFSNIDLDKGLRTVLSKIDDLLTPSNIKVNNVEKLMSCKKLLVEKELQYKTANIDTKDDTGQDKLREEFKNLLLESLDNFYQYDGIIKLTPLDTNINKLKDYRLSVNIDKQEGYEIRSSKIDFRADNPEWFILFNQIKNNNEINLNLSSYLTHIEFDIFPISDNKEIEKSTWIQLIEPIKLQNKLNVNNWPLIIREFPDKPKIVSFSAEQIFEDRDKEAINWNFDLGKWRYQNTINGNFILETDKIDITIKVKLPDTMAKTSKVFKSVEEMRSFSGFIAYWSSIINSAQFTNREFIVDLDDILSPKKKLKTKVNTEPRIKEYKFSIFGEKGKGIFSWKILKQPDVPFDVDVKGDATSVSFILSGDCVNIFHEGVGDENIKFCSLLSNITLKRNYKAENVDIVYTTEPIEPSSWATPHIKFFKPIKLDHSFTFQDLFNKIGEIKLPYKTNAKHLISISNLEINRDVKLPVIPVLQMEFKEGILPSENPFDNIFKNYTNGYPSISVTIYNNSEQSGVENDLPIFFANNIYKLKQ